MGEIVAAVGTCHTPYMFTRPPDEKPEQLDQASAGMAELGKVLDETKPDVIVGDVDGVVVVPMHAAAEVARLGTDRVAKEQKTRERLRGGELGLDFYGFRARLQELGVRYVDDEQEGR